ncbi:MAG: nitroreductase/quinone reductase family protein [Acidimicrobiia bacterium]
MPPDETIVARLARTRTVGLVTTGRRTGRPQRVEIWWFHFEGRFIISGTPGPRDWYANILANSRVVIGTRH